MTCSISYVVTTVMAFGILVGLHVASGTQIIDLRSEGLPCGNTTCTGSGELCCAETSCYNPNEGEYCCQPAKDSEYPMSVICARGQTCCGEGIAMVSICINPLNETCCTQESPVALSTSCPLGDTCCPTWGPPMLFDCCGGSKASTCCSNGEDGAAANGFCCAEHTTCCLIADNSYVTCCNKTERCGVDSCIGLP